MTTDDTPVRPSAVTTAQPNAPRHAFSIDVEEWYQVGAYENAIDRAAWPTCESRVAAQMDRLLAYLDENGAKATLFWLGSVAADHPDLLRRCHAAGHEIGCHGWDHKRLTALTDAEVHSDIGRAKSTLEDITGAPVTGYRAPSFSLSPDRMAVYASLAELGFTYSSSIYPIRHDHYGDAAAPRRPHRVAGGALLEYPMTTYAAFGRRWPAAGGGYFRLMPYRLAAHMFFAGAKQCGGGVFYMHPWEIDPAQPRVSAPWVSRFRHRTNLGRMADKVARLLTEARFVCMRDLINPGAGQEGAR